MSARSRSSSNPLAAAVAEALESRQLLSAYISNGTLFADGTSGNDGIRVYEDTSTEKVAVTINGVTTRFDPSRLNGSIRIRGMAGNDRLASEMVGYLGSENLHWRSTLEGGSGNDYFYNHWDYSGSTMLGGTGDDHYEHDESSVSPFDGGDGRDKISVLGTYDDGTLDLRDFTSVEDAFLEDGRHRRPQPADHRLLRRDRGPRRERHAQRRCGRQLVLRRRRQRPDHRPPDGRRLQRRGRHAQRRRRQRHARRRPRG